MAMTWFETTSRHEKQTPTGRKLCCPATNNGYHVYKWTGSAWALTATLSSTATSYAATGLASKGAYYFYVDAFNSNGASATNYQLVWTP